MIFGQEVERLFLLAIGHLPARRLWDEEDSSHHNHASKALEDQRDSPLQIIVNRVAAVGDGGSRDGATKPAGVVEA